ncbi:ATP-binding cassette domain-containing protein [Mesoplasma photuris]|uniref:ATP-binding cassette domain-containing protein n=1 Tax=Mesoplasma photuris TaxID=217731 RepID=UPI000AC7DB07|nr:ATP-binding cassette domain-containing protein [Mesoplasma photuris]
MKIDNLNINSGEVIALCGENGSGKSTFVDLITGVKYFEQGRIDINTAIEDPSSIFSVTFQHTSFANESIYRLITFFLKINKLWSSENLNKILIDFELLDLKDKLYTELSFGQQQRLKFALALIKPFKILIIDEIFSGLDSRWRRKIKNLIVDLKNKDLTVILISHEVNEITDLANRVLHFENGRIINDFKLMGSNLEKKEFLIEKITYLKDWEEN